MQKPHTIANPPAGAQPMLLTSFSFSREAGCTGGGVVGVCKSDGCVLQKLPTCRPACRWQLAAAGQPTPAAADAASLRLRGNARSSPPGTGHLPYCFSKIVYTRPRAYGERAQHTCSPGRQPPPSRKGSHPTARLALRATPCRNAQQGTRHVSYVVHWRHPVVHLLSPRWLLPPT